MTTATVDVCATTKPFVPCCPICGSTLDPNLDEVLCNECEADQAEKWTDYCAELDQAWHPY